MRLPVLFLEPFFVFRPKRNPKRKTIANPSIEPIANESTAILLQRNRHAIVMLFGLPSSTKSSQRLPEPLSAFDDTIRDTNGAPLARAASSYQRPGSASKLMPGFFDVLKRDYCCPSLHYQRAARAHRSAKRLNERSEWIPRHPQPKSSAAGLASAPTSSQARSTAFSFPICSSVLPGIPQKRNITHCTQSSLLGNSIAGISLPHLERRQVPSASILIAIRHE